MRKLVTRWTVLWRYDEADHWRCSGLNETRKDGELLRRQLYGPPGHRYGTSLLIRVTIDPIAAKVVCRECEKRKREQLNRFQGVEDAFRRKRASGKSRRTARAKPAAGRKRKASRPAASMSKSGCARRTRASRSAPDSQFLESVLYR